MEWREEGLILGVRKHGETSAILELMTGSRGRHLGLVRGGRSRKMRPLLQPGNTVEVVWRARLDEHLGHYQVEPVNLRAATLMQSRIGLLLVQSLSNHLRLLAEREPHAGLLDAATILLENLELPSIVANLLIRFEIALLEELGFGLDLTKCVVNGTPENLKWVSPKSGCAVSGLAGEKWADKLLPLPPFLIQTGTQKAPIVPDKLDFENGFKLTGFFLNRDIYKPRGMAPSLERDGLIQQLLNSNSE